jgi:DUF2075 family protein
MRLYEGSVGEFKQDVLNNEIADILKKNYLEKIKAKVNEAEYRSWETSLRVLKDSLDTPKLIENKIVIEYRLPYSERRIDVILFGKSYENKDTVVIIELKQWSNISVKDSEIEGNLEVDYGSGIHQAAHPCLQVQGYVVDMKDFIKVFQETPNLDLFGCVYCHNYTRTEDSVLYQSKFQEPIKKYPLFSKQDVKKAGEYLIEKLSKSSGFEVFNRFINSPIGPSRKLLDHVGEMIGKQQVFNLIDDQITAYNTIMDRAKRQAKQHNKSVIIVKGGPGTGKSVIALEVMGELMRSNKTVFHATGSSAFTKTLRKIVGRRAEKFYKFFFSFTKLKDNEIPVLICDEAHRIRKDSNDYGVPFLYKSKEPQIDDLIRPAKLSVFFIDEYQIVRPNEIGSVGLIKESAKKLGVLENNIFEFELKTQFRCSGSDTYLQWLENTLNIRESEIQLLTKDIGMEFKIFNSPAELQKAIYQKNKEKDNSARIVAGFCWPWSDPKPDGSLVNDVKIGEFEMPWENKKKAWLWATDDSGMEQVGTVYTSQGFEFDYIGVIFSNDLIYDKKQEKWISKPENSSDSMAKRGNDNFTQHLKNVYRVLMSRAHKGVYIYFMDDDTRNFFESRIKNEN